MNTAQQSRGKFTRICVELDLDKPLVPFYRVDGEVLNFEYEGIRMVCFVCGKFGQEALPRQKKPEKLRATR